MGNESVRRDYFEEKKVMKPKGNHRPGGRQRRNAFAKDAARHYSWNLPVHSYGFSISFSGMEEKLRRGPALGRFHHRPVGFAGRPDAGNARKNEKRGAPDERRIRHAFRGQAFSDDYLR